METEDQLSQSIDFAGDFIIISTIVGISQPKIEPKIFMIQFLANTFKCFFTFFSYESKSHEKNIANKR